MPIEFHRDGPWELPEGWVWAPLRNFLKFRRETVDPMRSPEEQFVLYSVPSYETGIPERLSGKEIGSSKQRVSTGDVLLCRINPRINRSWIVGSHDGEPAIASTEWIVLNGSDAIEPSYLQWVLRQDRVRNFLAANVSGVGGSLMRVKPSTIADFLIPIAPIGEQRRIVARIDELFTEIAEGETALARAREDLDTWRRALLKAAVTGELTREWREQNPSNETGQDVVARLRQAISATVGSLTRKSRRAAVQDQVEVDLAELPELPHGWNWSRVGEIGHVTGGLTKNPDRASVTQKLPYLRVANVRYGELDLTNIQELGVVDSELSRVLLRTNDLLIVEGNGSVDQIGRCAIWAGEIDPCVHQNHIIKVRFNDPQIAYWAFHWLMSPHGRQLVTKVASSTSGLHTLSISKIEALPIPICPSEELVQILHVLATEADDEGTIEIELGEGTKSLSPLRQTVLKAAFEGRLVEQDPRDEPADRLLARLSEQTDAVATPRRKARVRRAALAAEQVSVSNPSGD